MKPAHRPGRPPRSPRGRRAAGVLAALVLAPGCSATLGGVPLGLLAFMVVMAALLALWEIQIEGKDGWAANAPCWRIEKGWVVKLTGGRPLTGYHLYMTLFLLGLVHLPLFFAAWSWRLECLVLGFYVGMVFLEDFLWFVLNPHFGIRNFRKGKIWWHKDWWGPVPAMYWFLAAIVLALFTLGGAAG